MNKKMSKRVMAMVFAVSLVASGPCWAGADADDGSAAADHGSLAIAATLTSNVDNSTNVDVAANDNYDYSTTIGINDIALSSNVLSGTVSNNNVSVGMGFVSKLKTGGNCIGHSAFTNAAGVTQTAQNSGLNSLVQQSTSVQANIR